MDLTDPSNLLSPLNPASPLWFGRSSDDATTSTAAPAPSSSPSSPSDGIVVAIAAGLAISFIVYIVGKVIEKTWFKDM